MKKSILFYALILHLVVFSAAVNADLIIMKNGDIIRGRIQSFVDGVFHIYQSGRPVALNPRDIARIDFDVAAPKNITASTDNSVTRNPGRSSSLNSDTSISPAGSGDLRIVNYKSLFQNDIFQIMGDVENMSKREARYVKVTVFLYDDKGEMVSSNFSYVIGESPHLKSGEQKSFKVNFLNPHASKVKRYTIRVESSLF